MLIQLGTIWIEFRVHHCRKKNDVANVVGATLSNGFLVCVLLGSTRKH